MVDMVELCQHKNHVRFDRLLVKITINWLIILLDYMGMILKKTHCPFDVPLSTGSITSSK